jgi:hypothetical protein
MAAAGLTEPRCVSERGLAMGGRPAERRFTVGGSGKSAARCHRMVLAVLEVRIHLPPAASHMRTERSLTCGGPPSPARRNPPGSGHQPDRLRVSVDRRRRAALPAVKQVWAALSAQADKEGWPAGRFLAALAEHEIAERGRRRLERHLAEARLPPGKTLDTFDFEAVPVVSKAQVMALAAGDAWLNNGANLLMLRS